MCLPNAFSCCSWLLGLPSPTSQLQAARGGRGTCFCPTRQLVTVRKLATTGDTVTVWTPYRNHLPPADSCLRSGSPDRGSLPTKVLPHRSTIRSAGLACTWPLHAPLLCLPNPISKLTSSEGHVMIRPTQHQLLPSSASPRLSVSLCRNESAPVDTSQCESPSRALQQHVHGLHLQLDRECQGYRGHTFQALCVPPKPSARLLSGAGWLLCWAGDA